MTVTIELTSQDEERLRESLARGDAQAAKNLLVESLAPTVEAMLANSHAAAAEHDFEALADQLANEWTRSVGCASLSDEAITRANIYGENA